MKSLARHIGPEATAVPTVLTLTLHSMSLFDHEKLKVYQEAIRFVTWSNDLLEDIPRSVAVHNQLDRASTSVALNIAEGNGNPPPTGAGSSTSPQRLRWSVRRASMS